MNRVEWAANMVKRYLMEKNVSAVGVRRLHYYIVSLPENERIMPGRNPRPYQNTLNDYKKLSEYLTQARIEGLIPWSWIIDEKNEPLIEAPPPRDLTAYIDYEIGKDLGYIPYLEYVEEIPEWEEFIESIDFKAKVRPPRFKHQTHRIVVAVEKATARERFEEICRKYGADLLIFTGQFSVTRVNDAVSRAKAENKPIALLYISDLDCAGWFMPQAFFRRIQEIYPHKDHVVVRVALTREQALKFNLPPAFDPDDKKYPEKQKKRFIQESGGRECIELDALDEDILVQLLEEELEKWAALDKDQEEYEKVKKEYEQKVEELREELDLSSFKEEYEEIREEFNQLVSKIQEFFKEIQDRVRSIESKKDDFIEKIKEKVEEIIKEGIEGNE